MSIDDQVASPQMDAPGAPESGYSVRSLVGSTWGAFAELVERNSGVFGGCWCMGQHQTSDGGSYLQVRGIDKKAGKQALVRRGPAHAALVFDEQGPAQGWAKSAGSMSSPSLLSTGGPIRNSPRRDPTGASPASTPTRTVAARALPERPSGARST